MDSRHGDNMTKHMTYKELCEQLDIKIESVRRLVMRKKWVRTKGNDGETRIHVPDEFLDRRNDRPNDNHMDSRDDSLNEVMVTLRIENAALKANLEAEKNRADTAEKDRDRWCQLANKPWFKRLF